MPDLDRDLLGHAVAVDEREVVIVHAAVVHVDLDLPGSEHDLRRAQRVLALVDGERRGQRRDRGRRHVQPVVPRERPERGGGEGRRPPRRAPRGRSPRCSVVVAREPAIPRLGGLEQARAAVVALDARERAPRQDRRRVAAEPLGDQRLVDRSGSRS